ncbi:MAG TPA: FAD-binding oxidoreductase [Acidimicrobiaceae bacterium]|nr:FAD-binding oxidoreductase [Acidimicrobiaceae bacterium]
MRASVEITPSRHGDARSPQARALQADLRRRIEGEVRFSTGDRALYSTDSSSYRQLPIGVVVPRSVDDVVATVDACREHGLPLLSRGGGTSLAGQCCNAAVVMDFSKHVHGLLDLDRQGQLARVQPGLVLDVLRKTGESGEPRVTFGPTPSTHDHCTIGGMIGNNACGNYSIMSEFYGAGPRMAHNVAEMEVLTYDGLRLRVGKTGEEELTRLAAEGGRRGQIYRDLRALRDRYGPLIRERLPEFPRRVSGYGLDGLLPEYGFDVAYALVGTESTCVTVLEATLHLVAGPPGRSLVVVGFEDIYEATGQIMEARRHRPVALEGFDAHLIEDNRKLGVHLGELEMLPDGEGWLMAEFGGETKDESDHKAERFMAAMRKAKGYRGEKLYDDEDAEERIWQVRESGLGATAFVPGSPDTYEGWEDSAVPPENLPSYLRGLRELFDKYEYGCALYGHFGQGCVHTRIDWDPHTADGVRKWRSFVDEASDLVLAHDGSLSGEHGDGQSRGELLEKMYGPEVVQMFREFKAIWDPDGKMNPGKVVDPYPITSNLRLGPDYEPETVKTHFSYPKDHGSFAHATVRCVGVGKCRRLEGGTMCPSFMVTHEEKDTTRGRARVLYEMMRRESEIALWRSSEVKDALELCLSCKGCKGDCPVNVDMATYKAEFLSHYYKGRPRPKVAYAMGMIWLWARFASKVPRAANFATHAPVVAGLLKRAAGIEPRRPAPEFAPVTFARWFAGRQEPAGGQPKVLLWPDTFTNYFHPEVGMAAVEVLEAAGFEPFLPGRPLCCGRPLYDYGMLDTAERLWRQVLDELGPHIRAGVPLVGLEPSCLAAFRDELPELFPTDLDAQRLARQSYVLAEFLERYASDWEMPRLQRKAIVQRHCHQQAVIGYDEDTKVMQRRLGLDVEVLDSGCCGLAGSFGFERGEKYEVSIGAGERVLFPAVRHSDESTLVVADGFSCRTQIEHNTERRGLHLAEVISMALRQGPAGPGVGKPEEHVTVTGRRHGG